LPFKTNTDEKKDRQINNIVKEFLSSSNDFLTSRNKILHHLLSPKGSIDEIGAYIEKTIKKFNGFRKINEEFVKYYIIIDLEKRKFSISMEIPNCTSYRSKHSTKLCLERRDSIYTVICVTSDYFV